MPLQNVGEMPVNVVLTISNCQMLYMNTCAADNYNDYYELIDCTSIVYLMTNLYASYIGLYGGPKMRPLYASLLTCRILIVG